MVTHWESSRRPLYVKTIWKDGQHHVILDKTKENSLETSQSRTTEQCCSNQNSQRSTKSANTGVNLKVSSVRALLSGVNGFKKSQRSARSQEHPSDKPKTWTKSAIARAVTSKNLNKEVTFNTVQGTKALNPYKSNTDNLERFPIEKSTQSASSYIPNNALSEKVMIWLDLATQHGHIDKEIKHGRAVTAQACQLLEKPRKKCKKNVDYPEETPDYSILKNGSPRDDLEKKEMIVYSNEEVEVLEEDFYHVLTPRIGEECDWEKVIDNKKKNRVNTAKRQLHIFMPNLPKKASDCNSTIFSSQVSVS